MYSSDGRGAAADHNIVIECRLRSRHGLFLRNADATHRATGTRNANCCVHRLVGSDALKNRVSAKAACELTHALNCLLASLADDICCAEFSGKGDPIGMAAEDDDLLSAESPRSDHATQADRAITNNGRRFSAANPGDYGGMMASAHHV